MAVLAIGCALAAADPRVVTAEGGIGVALLHVLGTGLFALTLLLEPRRIRARNLGVVAVLLGASTSLEVLYAAFPWSDVQDIVRSGCALVAVSMACLLIYALRPTAALKGFFISGLVIGAAGSLTVSVGVLLAAKASYPHDLLAVCANLIIAIGAWGVGCRCLGLRFLRPSWQDQIDAALALVETRAPGRDARAA